MCQISSKTTAAPENLNIVDIMPKPLIQEIIDREMMEFWLQGSLNSSKYPGGRKYSYCSSHFWIYSHFSKTNKK
jgi:hypothetical protein